MGTSIKPRGRRTFGSNGQEELREASRPHDQEEPRDVSRPPDDQEALRGVSRQEVSREVASRPISPAPHLTQPTHPPKGKQEE